MLMLILILILILEGLTADEAFRLCLTLQRVEAAAKSFVFVKGGRSFSVNGERQAKPSLPVI